jgi:hypothetical protein
MASATEVPIAGDDGDLEFTEEDFDKLSSLADIYSYQGFNTANMKKALFKLARLKKRNFKSDMVAMVTLFMTRGSSILKITQKMSTEGKDSVLLLKSAYGIEGGRSKGTMGKDTVTLARVAACYPTIAVKLVEKGLSRDVCPGHYSPAWMHWTQFPSVIPKESKFDPLFELWQSWAIEADVVLNAENSNPENVIKYGTIVRNSSTLVKEDRNALLRALGFKGFKSLAAYASGSEHRASTSSVSAEVKETTSAEAKKDEDDFG